MAGRINDQRFQKAKAAAEALSEFHGEEVESHVTGYVPAEWDVAKEKILMVNPIHTVEERSRWFTGVTGTRGRGALQAAQGVTSGVECGC